MPYSVKEIYDNVCERFKDTKRLPHIIGVAETAKALAKLYNLDEEKCYIAGLLHDYEKYTDYEEMKKLINDESIIERFKNGKKVWHAFAAANSIQKIFGITDKDIIEAVRYHVFGCINMSDYVKVLVLADYIDPTREYEECIRVRNYFNLTHDLDGALIKMTEDTIKNLLDNGVTPDPEQYEILKQLDK